MSSPGHVSDLAPDHPGPPDAALGLRPRRAEPGRGELVARALVAADLLAFSVAIILAELLFAPDGSAVDRLSPQIEYLVFLATLPAWIAIARLYGLYHADGARVDHSTVDDLPRIVQLVTVSTWGLWLVLGLTGTAAPLPKKVAVFWSLAIVLVVAMRSAARAVCRRSPHYVQNAVIVGAGDVGQRIARKLLLHPEYGIRPLGFVDREPKERAADVRHLSVLGSPERLPEIVDELDVDRAIFAFSQHEQHEPTVQLVRALMDAKVHVDIVPRLFEALRPTATLCSIEGLPVLGLAPPRLTRQALLLKRGVDVLVSAIALLLLAPLLLVIAALIKWESEGPVFFRQLRIGCDDSPFSILKFRTMHVDAEARRAELEHLNRHVARGDGAALFKIEGDPRVTRIGRLLRARALDELPQLVNVLRGDMSLVGARPLVLSEDRQVDAWARRRLDIKPGITGLWQVLGGSRSMAFEEMLTLDFLYVTSWSLWLDCWLLLRTIPIVLKGGQGDY